MSKCVFFQRVQGRRLNYEFACFDRLFFLLFFSKVEADLFFEEFFIE